MAIKVLGALDPAANEAFAALADQYAQGAPTLGRAVRLGLPHPEAAVPRDAWLPSDLDEKTLLASALAVATSRARVDTVGLANARELVSGLP